MGASLENGAGEVLRRYYAEQAAGLHMLLSGSNNTHVRVTLRGPPYFGLPE